MLIEKDMKLKCPGFGCHHHMTERLEDAAMHHVHEPTSSPEEGISKNFKTWLNAPGEKHVNNVREVNYKKIVLAQGTRRIRR